MRKIGSVLLVVLLVFSSFSVMVSALENAPDMGDYTQDAEGFSLCYSDYMEYYLFGIPAESRASIAAQVKEGYSQGEIPMMSLMTAFANVRKAGQVAETEENQGNGKKPTVDVVKQYYLLTQEQKTEFFTYFSASLTAMGLQSRIADGKIAVLKANTLLAEIQLVTEKPKSSTRKYLDAYLPGLTEEEKNGIETLVAEYSQEGGSPAGSGALWRCIREIGELMGVEAESKVDMQAGTMQIVVIKAGETYLKNCTPKVQEDVIAKAKEGLEAIGCSGEYAEGIFTVSKAGRIRMTHTVIEQDLISPEETEKETEQEEKETEKNPIPQTGDPGSAVIFLILGSAFGLGILCRTLPGKDKISAEKE